MSAAPLSRRVVLVAALLFSGRTAAAASPKVALPLDNGIGGTGAAPDPDETNRDRGIGGTGVVGTISRLDAMVVNGVRIMHPARLRVVIDGAVRSAAALRVGHTAAATGTDRDGVLTTRRIDVSSEVVGPIQAVGPDGLVVLGQRVHAPQDRWRVGDVVAAFGLRQADGTVAASLIEARPGAAARVAGVATRTGTEPPTIGALPLSGFPPALLGQRCIVEGRFDGRTLAVTRVRPERDELLRSRPRQLLLEAFVRRNGAYVALGSGLAVDGSAEGLPLPDTGETRAVVTLDITRAGDLAVVGVRPERSNGSARSGRHGPAPTFGGAPDGRPGPSAAPSGPGGGGSQGRGSGGAGGRGGGGGR